MSKRDLKQYSIKKSEKMTEEKAMSRAKNAMDTFEGNLKADHTETHFVFKRVR